MTQTHPGVKPLPHGDGWIESCSKTCDILSQVLLQDAAKTLFLAWTGGKDSTLLLRLALDTATRLCLPPPRVLHIDEGDPFPEITSFMAATRRQWAMDLVMIRNDDLLGQGCPVGSWVEAERLSAENREELRRAGFDGQGFVFDPETFPASHLAKTAPLRWFLERQNVATLVTAIRRDEHPSRYAEEVFSLRTSPRHLRVHPLLHFHERQVWDATLAMNLPFCSLYGQGYRSLGARSGTSRNADVPAWEQDLEGTPERAGRHQGKEASMDQLRALGYM